MSKYILNLDVTFADVQQFLENPQNNVLLGYTYTNMQLGMLNKIDLVNVKIFNCAYNYNYPASVIIISEEMAANIKVILTSINHIANVIILSPTKIRNTNNMKYISKEDSLHKYIYEPSNLIANTSYDTPYDFSIYPLFIISQAIFDNKSYNIIREDLNPGGWYTRTIGQLYKKFAKYDTIGIIYNGVFKYLIAEIFCALQLQSQMESQLTKKIYVFSVVKSHSVAKFIKRFHNYKKIITYIYIYDYNSEVITSRQDIYSKHKALHLVRQHIKTLGLHNIKLLYGVFALEKYNMLAKNVLHSIPLSMLHHGVRLWILYEPNNYINLIFTDAYKKFGYNIEILQVVISLSKFPGNSEENICVKDGIYYIRDSIYKKTSDQEELPVINMSRYTESKYWPLIKKYGKEGDYILNYHGDVPHQIELFKKSGLLL